MTDKDNTYTWNAVLLGLGEEPDGTAFTSFLATLNDPGNGLCASGGPTGGCCLNYTCEDVDCFAGRCDWRLPTFVDLQTILDCGFSSCIDPVFGPTASFLYWSASTFANGPGFAWLVNFDHGGLGFLDKSGAFHVRAVRAGSCP